MAATMAKMAASLGKVPQQAGDVDTKAASKAAKAKGVEAFTKKDYDTAIKFFSEAISWDANSHVLFSNRSATYTLQKKYSKAIFDAKRCIAIKPKWAKGYVRLGTALLRAKDYSGAKAAFTTATELDPKNSGAKLGLAKATEFAGKSSGKDDTNFVAPATDAAADGETEEGASKESGEPTEYAVGIDLGTTNSCVAVFRNGNVEIIPNDEGKRTTPSIVSFMADNMRLVGDAAKAQAPSNPENTLYETKRLIGRPFSDAHVQSDIKKMPFKIVKGNGDCPMFEITTKTTTGEGEDAKETESTVKYAPEQISALVLAKMKATAEKYLDCPVTKAVITVPAYFNDAQRNATKAAGNIAGLEVLRIINEPTAAALAYGLDKAAGAAVVGSGEATNVLVFDLGGGTFDVSLLSIEGGIFEVRATGGDTHLGGEDFDDLMMQFLATEVKRKHRKQADDLLANPRVMRQLRRASEECKRTLSAATSATVELEDLTGKSGESVDFSTVVTRAKFERLCKEPFNRCVETVKKVLKDARMTVEDVDDVVLVGGSTRIPKVQEMLQAYFKGKSLCHSVNPDEAVAFGAAVQAAIMTGVRDNTTSQLLLVDVTPLSLGIETVGRVMSVLIKRNTAIPCEMTKTYTTDHNYQEAVTIPIFEGERTCTDGNNSLGEFTITGIQRAKRGEPKIAVTFNLDADGILKVKAVDEVTGAENRIEISNKGRLSSDEVERMIQDAKEFEKEDAERLKQMEAMHELEEVLYRADDTLTSFRSGTQALAASATRMKAMDHLRIVMDSSRMWVESKLRNAAGSAALDTTRRHQQKLEQALFAFTIGMH